MPRSIVSGVEEYRVSDDELRLTCRVQRRDRPIEREDLTVTESTEETAFGVDEEGKPLGNVPLDERRTVPVTLRFYGPSTFRFELRANPEAGRPERLIDLEEGAVDEPVDLTAEEVDDALHVETADLTVRIGLDEWSFSVTDGRGVLFSEQRDDFDAKGRARVDPLGFDEEMTTRWPYRVSAAGTSFRLGADERFYGFGEKFTALDKRGHSVESWVTQPNGCETGDAYKNVPFYLSTRGYGLLVDTAHRTEFDLGDTSTSSGEISVDDDTFSFVFFAGPSFADVIDSYTALTGRPRRPPKWTFGTWLSRYGLTDRELVEDVVDRIREEELPWDGIKIDPYWLRRGHSSDMVWDTDAFPDPEEMIEELHDRDIRVVLWEHPYLPTETEAFETAREEGYFVTDGAGTPYVLDRLAESSHRGAIVDFTDPEAAEWWKDKHRDLLEMGVDGFWTDFGEYLPRDAVLSNGRSGRAMRNVYPEVYKRAVYDVTAEVNGEDEAFVWARAGWIGGQRIPMYWSGDPGTTFEAMAAVLRGGLSLALSGAPFWSHDIGGFKGEPTPELYVRWAQFGLLSPQARFHGTTPREPWEFGERATEIVRTFSELRYSLLPYIYTHAEIASRTGLPVMRPLVLEYQDDPAVRDEGTQYLLGDALLVAPVLEAGGRVDVTLPEGEWVDFWSGERHEGGGTLRFEELPLDELPLFVRAESIVPRREPTQSVQAGTPERVTLDVTLAAEGETEATGRFYDEDRDRMIDLAARAGSDRETLVLSVSDPERTELFEAVVDGLEGPPDEVIVEGEALDRVDDEPRPGEWTYDGEADELVANLPS